MPHIIRNPRRAVAIAGAIGAVSAICLLYLFNPAESRLFPPCPFTWVTGWRCPGCGSLRAMHHLLRGRVTAAFALNPLMVVLLPVLGLLLLNPSWIYKRWVPWFFFVILVGYGIARNLPSAWFGLPMFGCGQ